MIEISVTALQCQFWHSFTRTEGNLMITKKPNCLYHKQVYGYC